MADILDLPARLPFPPTPERDAPTADDAPLMKDCPFLEIVHVFEDPDEDKTAVTGLVANNQWNEDYSENDYDILRCAVVELCEKHFEGIIMNPGMYAYGAVKLARGYRFIYVSMFWFKTNSERLH